VTVVIFGHKSFFLLTYSLTYLPCDVFSGEQLLSLIKQAPSSDKKQHARDDRGRSVPSTANRDMRSKARPASELEAQWKKEVDAKKAQEDEARRLEDEKRRQEEEKAEQERLEKV